MNTDIENYFHFYMLAKDLTHLHLKGLLFNIDLLL